MARVRVRRYHPVVEGYLTIEQLAEYLGLKSTGSLRVQIRLGAIKAERVGKKTLIVSIQEAERYKRERNPGPGRPRKPAPTNGGTDAAK